MKVPATVIAILFCGMALAPSARANDTLIEMSKNPADWVMPLGNYAGHRYSALDQINEHNAHKLQVAWMFSTGVLRGHAGAPLKVGNRLYVHTPFPNEVVALDLEKNQSIIWQYNPQQDSSVVDKMCCGTVNRGLAYSDRTLFLHQANATLVAIDARTGKEIWKAPNGDWKNGETGTAAPLVVKDKVLVGVSSDHFGVRCHLTAYDKKTGKRVWRAYTAGPDEDILFDPKSTTVLGKPVGGNSSLKSWHNTQWLQSGGCAWGWITYDPELNLIYYGTGFPAPMNPVQRPGDNKWTSSIIARDADTGTARWVYQTTPHDEWSYGAAAEPILIDQEVDGQTRKALVQFNQNGLVYVLDRATGELLSAEKFDPNTNWAKKIELDLENKAFGRPLKDNAFSPGSVGENKNTQNICPDSSQGGAKAQQPAAYHPMLQTFVVPTHRACMDYEPFPVNFTPGQLFAGVTRAFVPPKHITNFGAVLSWSPTGAQQIWTKNEPLVVYSGPLVTKGNVAFYGTVRGDFVARRLSDGHELYRFKVGSGIIGNPISYEHQGKQYVAVLTGVGGPPGFDVVDPRSVFYKGRHYVHYHISLITGHVKAGGNLVVFALP